MLIYYIEVVGSNSDIVWWEKDISIGNDRLSSYAFFRNKERAEKYIKYLDDDITYKIKSVEV